MNKWMNKIPLFFLHLTMPKLCSSVRWIRHLCAFRSLKAVNIRRWRSSNKNLLDLMLTVLIREVSSITALRTQRWNVQICQKIYIQKSNHYNLPKKVRSLRCSVVRQMAQARKVSKKVLMILVQRSCFRSTRGDLFTHSHQNWKVVQQRVWLRMRWDIPEDPQTGLQRLQKRLWTFKTDQSKVDQMDQTDYERIKQLDLDQSRPLNGRLGRSGAFNIPPILSSVPPHPKDYLEMSH